MAGWVENPASGRQGGPSGLARGWKSLHQAAVPNASDRFAEGDFVDETHAERVRTLGRRAAQYANIDPDPYSFESEENVGARTDPPRSRRQTLQGQDGDGTVPATRGPRWPGEAV